MTFTTTSAGDLLAQLRDGSLGAAELMQATLERIDAVNGEVNAIVGLRDAGDLMAEARAKDSGAKTGPLHGLPIAVKDLVNVKGLRSTQGSPIFKDLVPEEDDLIAARMRAAGAILIGKTNVPEFGLGSQTFNQVYGATCNPYKTTHTCGGSSGGAAVALATGMTALADGSDMMGSLRNPASWNNVYGFRPSFGRVPTDAKGDTFLHQLSTLGPMARSPEDIGILLDVISGGSPLVPHSAPSDAVSPVAAADLKGMRIGCLGDWSGAFAMEPGIIDNAQDALRVMGDLGASVEVVPAPFSADALWDSWTTLRSWTMGCNLGPLMEHKGLLKETAIWEVERGLAMSAIEVHRASVIRSDWFTAAARMFERFDALVLPVAQVWPFPLEQEYPMEINGTKMDTYHRWMQVSIPASLIGLPALAAPAGFSETGLPGGVQIIGPRNSDAKLLKIGAAYHAATMWPQKRPALPVA